MQAFETSIRSVCEPIFEKPLKDISFGLVLMGLFQTARRFNMEVQPQLVLLQKTLLNIEGLGRQLYPDLDLWQTAQPFLERWMKERMGPKAVYHSMKQQAPDWLDKMPHLPQMAYEALHQLKNLDDNRRRDMLALAVAREELKKQQGSRNRWFGAVALLAAAAFALDQPMDMLEQLPGH